MDIALRSLPHLGVSSHQKSVLACLRVLALVLAFITAITSRTRQR